METDTYWLFYVPDSPGIAHGQRGPALPAHPKTFTSLDDAKDVPIPAGFSPWIQGPLGYWTFSAGQWRLLPFGGTSRDPSEMQAVWNMAEPNPTR